MGSKKPVLVSNVGWFTELPDNSCIKIDVGHDEEELLVECMLALSSDRRLRETIGANAYSYVARVHSPDVIASEYYSFMNNILNGNEFLITSISEQMDRIAIGPEDTSLIANATDKIMDLFNAR
jgi:hypothetical protein